MSDTKGQTVADLEALVLAGGFGTRLRPSIANTPKCLADVRGRPFIQYLIDSLETQGVRHVVLCTGYLGELVQEALGGGRTAMPITYSRESTPLGTGGALRLALAHTAADTLLVLNGDSFCEADLGSFLKFHRKRNATASILLTEVEDSSRFGRVWLNDEDRVTRFEEKCIASGRGWINAGIYLLSRSILEEITADKSVSLESECFPDWVGRGLYAWRGGGRFLDIGTPQSYQQAEEFFINLKLQPKD